MQKPANLASAQQRFGLGIGELSIIMLGRELKADLVLIDDLKARNLAREEGLAVLGCVGVLHDAFGREVGIRSARSLSPTACFGRLRGSRNAGKYSEDS